MKIKYSLLVVMISTIMSAQTFQLVKDVNPSANWLNLNCSFQEMNGKVYYVFLDESIQQFALFTTDGTPGGTFRISPPDVSVNGSIIIGGDKIYFFASSPNTGLEPYVSDGTLAGTQMLMDINPSADLFYFGTWGSKFLSADENKAYFVANNDQTGLELWITDGTSGGTHLVKEIYGGSTGTQISTLASMGTNMKDGKFYFFAIDGQTSGGFGTTITGLEPYVSDGTEAGTFMLKDIKLGYQGSGENATKHFIEFGDKMYFYAAGEAGSGLWQTDGTAEGTVLIYSTGIYRIDEFRIFQGLLYFTVSDTPSLYATDGTTAGTSLVAAIPNGQLNNNATSQMTELNGQLMMRVVSNSLGAELFKLENGQITLVNDINTTTSGISGNVYTDKKIFQVYDERIWFLASDGSQSGAAQMWASDGTESGTIAYSPLNGDNGWAGGMGDSYNIFASSIGMFMIYSNSAIGSELYRYDAQLGIPKAQVAEPFLFPNPANGTVNLQNIDPADGVATIHDLSGRQISKKELESTLDISDLPVGTYIVKVRTSVSAYSLKLIVK